MVAKEKCKIWLKLSTSGILLGKIDCCYWLVAQQQTLLETSWHTCLTCWLLRNNKVSLVAAKKIFEKNALFYRKLCNPVLGHLVTIYSMAKWPPSCYNEKQVSIVFFMLITITWVFILFQSYQAISQRIYSPVLKVCHFELLHEWLSGKLWYLQHICVGDTIVYH